MLSQEEWQVLAKPDKMGILAACLQQIYNIEHGTHELSGKPEQGKLSALKKELESFAKNVIQWETK